MQMWKNNAFICSCFKAKPMQTSMYANVLSLSCSKIQYKDVDE